MGVGPRVSLRRSPRRDVECCLPVCTHLGQNPTVTKFRGSIPFRVGQLLPTFHPRFLSVYASTLNFGWATPLTPYINAATLDTEPLAKSYSGGSLTHLSSNHFQHARGIALFCSHQLPHVFARKPKIYGSIPAVHSPHEEKTIRMRAFHSRKDI